VNDLVQDEEGARSGPAGGDQEPNRGVKTFQHWREVERLAKSVYTTVSCAQRCCAVIRPPARPPARPPPLHPPSLWPAPVV